MKNILVFDDSFDCVLLINEGEKENSIWIEVKTNSSTNQILEIMIDGVTAAVALSSDSENKILLTNSYWNFGGTTSIRLSNDDAQSEYVTIIFPEIITTDSAIYPSGERQYSLQGQYNVEQAIDNVKNQMQGQIDDANGRIMAVIPPYSVDRNEISDGGNNDVITFKFNCTQDNPPVLLYAMLNYTITTSVSAQGVYHDCTVTIYYNLDGATVATIQQTYGDGKQVVMLNYQLQNLTAENHTFVVNIGVSGGTLS